MQVIVRDRVAGKTTALVNWLLNGRPCYDRSFTDVHWSRHIVTCHGERERERLKRIVRYTIPDLAVVRAWSPRDIEAALKAVWSLDTLREEIRGTALGPNNRNAPKVEYAVDDLGVLLDRHISSVVGIRPALLTIEGTYEP